MFHYNLILICVMHKFFIKQLLSRLAYLLWYLNLTSEIVSCNLHDGVFRYYFDWNDMFCTNKALRLLKIQSWFKTILEMIMKGKYLTRKLIFNNCFMLPEWPAVMNTCHGSKMYLVNVTQEVSWKKCINFKEKFIRKKINKLKLIQNGHTLSLVIFCEWNSVKSRNNLVISSSLINHAIYLKPSYLPSSGIKENNAYYSCFRDNRQPCEL